MCCMSGDQEEGADAEAEAGAGAEARAEAGAEAADAKAEADAAARAAGTDAAAGGAVAVCEVLLPTTLRGRRRLLALALRPQLALMGMAEDDETEARFRAFAFGVIPEALRAGCRPRAAWAAVLPVRGLQLALVDVVVDVDVLGLVFGLTLVLALALVVTLVALAVSLPVIPVLMVVEDNECVLVDEVELELEVDVELCVDVDVERRSPGIRKLAVVPAATPDACTPGFDAAAADDGT